MPTHDCMWTCYSCTEFSPRSHLSQHAHSQEIYDSLKQSHSWRSVPRMALLHEQRVNGFCHHTLLQQGHVWVHNMPPCTVSRAEIYPRQGTFTPTQGLATQSCRLLQTLGFSQESPFLCLHTVTWNLRHKPAKGPRLKMQKTTKLRIELPTRCLSKICLLHSHSFQATTTKSIVPVDHKHCCAYNPYSCSRNAGLIPPSKTPLLSNCLMLRVCLNKATPEAEPEAPVCHADSCRSCRSWKSAPDF